MPVQTHTPQPALGPLAARLLVPSWVLVLAGMQIADGTTDALPVWLGGVASRSGLEPELLLRLLLGAEFLGAGLMLLLGRWSRAVALLAMIVACFSAIASISALPGDRSLVLGNVLVLAISALLLWLVRGRPDSGPDTLSPQWRAIGALAVLVIAASVAARVGIRSTRPPERVVRHIKPVELDFADALSKPMSDTPLKTYLPEITARTLEGRSYLVFYNPRCESCHDLFRERFMTPVDGRVIAVRVPPEEGAVLAASDADEEIDCFECERLDLPTGPLWLIQPPVIVRVDDGVITCVNVRGESTCVAGK